MRTYKYRVGDTLSHVSLNEISTITDRFRFTTPFTTENFYRISTREGAEHESDLDSWWTRRRTCSEYDCLALVTHRVYNQRGINKGVYCSRHADDVAFAEIGEPRQI